MLAAAKAHAMQALVHYHGLKDWDLRIPFHDSISVNVDSLFTITKVEFGDFQHDSVTVDDKSLGDKELARSLRVLDEVRRLAGISDKARVTSNNSLPYGSAKGLGFSAAAGAALAAASYKAARLDKEHGWDLSLVSRLARRLAGSACRSVVGEYARWYAGNNDEDSYARRIATRDELDLSMVVVPLRLEASTEDAHREAVDSTFFKARVASAQSRADEMEKAIKEGDFRAVGEMAELDSLELHAVTMSGPSGLILFQPESIRVINAVRELRSEGLEVYYSMQTGPSVFINTHRDTVGAVSERIKSLGLEVLVSGVGPEVSIKRT